LTVKIHEREAKSEQKLEAMKERMKRVEKTVYERVEQEYSQTLRSKEEEICELQSFIAELSD